MPKKAERGRIVNRKRLTGDEAKHALVRSRRRCCVCFGLNRDTGLKSGQIAHLDRNRSNNDEDNLAFLCLIHHDEYDSRSSQKKGFTIEEVKHYREELVRTLTAAFDTEVSFGMARARPTDEISGYYVRVKGGESAFIKVVLAPPLANGERRYYVSGQALWGEKREFGPNMGTLDFVAELSDNEIIHTSNYYAGKEYKVVLRFDGDKLLVSEENWIGIHGMNVTFEGEYEPSVGSCE